jgi:hypothetical protein
VDVDGAVGAAPRQLPHLPEQVALGDDLAGAPGEREQQLELRAVSWAAVNGLMT